MARFTKEDAIEKATQVAAHKPALPLFANSTVMARRHYLQWLGLGSAMVLPQLLAPGVYAKQTPGFGSVAAKREQRLLDPVTLRIASLDPGARALLPFAQQKVNNHFSVRSTTAANSLRTHTNSRVHGRLFFESRFESRQRLLPMARPAQIELWLTDSDIMEEGRPFVFGLTSVTDRVALVSTARIRDPNRQRFLSRLEKLIVHEVGHALELEHHAKAGCVMRVEPDVRALDRASAVFCRACRNKLKKNTSRLQRRGQMQLDQLFAYAARGHEQRALALAQSLAKLPQVHPEVRNKSGAFLDSLRSTRYSAQGQIRGQGQRQGHHHH